MTLTAENPSVANEISEVRYLTVEELRNGFDEGRYKHFRHQYYIRSEITEKSIEDKKRALISFDHETGEHFVQVFEPMVFETNEDGSFNIVSGNTRAVALIALYEAGSYTLGDSKNPQKILLPKESFRPIPYRVYNRLLTVHELIDYQISTNDSTESHNPLDLAITIARLKPVYEAELVEKYKSTFGKEPSPKELRTISGMATERLCADFKKTKAAISQYLNVANKGTEKLKQFVASGKASLDTANTVVQKLGGDKAKPEAIDKAIDELWTQAKINTGKGDDATIYKSQVLDYFSDKEALLEKRTAKTPASTTTTTTTTSENKETVVETVVVTPKELLQNIHDTLDIVYTIKSQEIKNDQTDKVRNLTTSMANSVLEVLELVSDDDVKQVYENFKSVFISVFGDAEKITQAIADNKVIELNKVNKLISKISKPAEKLYKELNAPPALPEKEATTEVITAADNTLETIDETVEPQTSTTVDEDAIW